jgi:hypothetical protein
MSQKLSFRRVEREARVMWCEAEVELECSCGQELWLNDEPQECTCGRVYRLIPYVAVAEREDV